MPKLWLIGGAGFLATLLIASIVVALTQRSEPQPEGTPERAVQLYLTALEDGDFKTVHSLLSAERRTECSVEELAFRDLGRAGRYADSRVTLVDANLLDGSAVVTVRITSIQRSGPFGTSDSSREERYTLLKEDGEWRLDRVAWPYSGCADALPRPAPPTRAPEPVPAPAPAPTPSP
jgi:hypothetical protein